MAQAFPRLILIEGLCGAGKSTLGARLQRYLADHDIPCAFYDEGAWPHPVSLNWHAYFTPSDYASLLARFPADGVWIEAHTVHDADYRLVAYRELAEFPEKKALYESLGERELCWTSAPVATAAQYARAVQDSWRRFAQSAARQERTIILEGVFLQHPIHDFLRNYPDCLDVISPHILACAQSVAPLDPALFYLNRPDVRAHMKWVAAVRGKAHYAQNTEIASMQRRYAIEEELVRTLPFPSHTLENRDRDWEAEFAQILRRLSL